jgi:hypothetical protein
MYNIFIYILIIIYIKKNKSFGVLLYNNKLLNTITFN